MKEFIRFIFLFFILTLCINAQDNSDIPSLKGKYALQFAISNNFTLSSFQGGVFSGKYFFSDNSSIRLGVSVGSSTDEDETTQNSLSSQNNISITTEANTDEKVYFYGINLQYIYNLKTTKDILFYTGVGPFFRISNNEKESNGSRIPDSYSMNSTISRNQKQTSIGAELICGIEWFVKSNISISAEYGAAFSYSHAKIDETRFESDSNVSTTKSASSTRNTYLINASNINFGVSFYF